MVQEIRHILRCWSYPVLDAVAEMVKREASPQISNKIIALAADGAYDRWCVYDTLQDPPQQEEAIKPTNGQYQFI